MQWMSLCGGAKQTPGERNEWRRRWCQHGTGLLALLAVGLGWPAVSFAAPPSAKTQRPFAARAARPAAQTKQPPATDTPAPAPCDSGHSSAVEVPTAPSAESGSTTGEPLQPKFVAASLTSTIEPVWRGQPLNFKFEIRNEGTADLYVTPKGG
ncbi:MAG: hypothetical protein HY763_09115 [Planctomycetes bacterium]|nr:hypothetical protein [Planctomycetota bacterium]